MSKKIKVLFLDCDGVLNSAQYMTACGGNFDHNQIDPAAVKRLNHITDTTGAKIVVSSTWRLLYDTLDELREALRGHGVTGEIIGKTPTKFNAVRNIRGKEIEAWLQENHGSYSKYVIIDDDRDVGLLAKHAVFTEFKTGLLDSHVDEILKRLS